MLCSIIYTLYTMCVYTYERTHPVAVGRYGPVRVCLLLRIQLTQRYSAVPTYEVLRFNHVRYTNYAAA